MRGPKGQCNRFVASCFCNVSLEWTISIIQQNDTYFPDAEWFAARETTLTGKIYWIFLCVFVCYSLYCPVCKYIYIFQSILYSFCVILSPVKIMKVTMAVDLRSYQQLLSLDFWFQRITFLFSGPTGGAWGWHVLWRRWDIWRRTWGMAMPGVVVRWMLSSKKIYQQHDSPVI